MVEFFKISKQLCTYCCSNWNRNRIVRIITQAGYPTFEGSLGTIVNILANFPGTNNFNHIGPTAIRSGRRRIHSAGEGFGLVDQWESRTLRSEEIKGVCGAAELLWIKFESHSPLGYILLLVHFSVLW